LVSFRAPQVETFTNSTSSGLEVKLDPDERDSHTCCGKQGSGPPPRAWVRSTPNSANCCATKAVPLIPLSPAAIAAWFALPSNSVGLTVDTCAPQQGGESVLTRHLPFLRPIGLDAWIA